MIVDFTNNNNKITKHQIDYYSHLQTSITSFNQLPTFTPANKLFCKVKEMIWKKFVIYDNWITTTIIQIKEYPAIKEYIATFEWLRFLTISF